MSEDGNKIVELGPVRDMVTGAQRVSAAAAEEPAGPPEAPADRDDGLPGDCPIKALGRDADGKTFYYLNELNQLTTLKPGEHTHQFFAAMCGRDIGYLVQQWPQKKSVKDEAGNIEWVVTGFHSGDIRDALMMASSRKGVWSPADRLRGRGAWRDDDGRIIMHCGDVLIRAEGGRLREIAPGEVGGYVYSAAAPLPRPAADVQAAGEEDGPAAELLHVLKTWNWARPDIDADLLFGWIGAAMIGGALDIRPLIWLTGGAGTGKSTLHQLLKMLLGDALTQTDNTTAAGLYQKEPAATLPIALDELEADADNGRQMEVIKLARSAFSGALFFRGGADHKGVQFQVRSAFLFSSILIPPLAKQDRERMAILNLQRFPEGQRALALDPRHWRGVGRAILRRLMDQWPRFQATLEAYADALAEVGHDLRGSRQLGTLLACRDLIFFNDVPDAETLAAWSAALKRARLGGEEDEADDIACLNHLSQAQPDHWRGGAKSSTAELVHQYLHSEAAGGGQDAMAALATGGMRLVHHFWKQEGDPWPREGAWYLAVANTHEGTRLLFRETRWEGKAGLEGVWKQSLRRLPGALPGNERIARRMTRCTLVPTSLILTGEEDAGGRPAAAFDLKQD